MVLNQLALSALEVEEQNWGDLWALGVVDAGKSRVGVAHHNYLA